MKKQRRKINRDIQVADELRNAQNAFCLRVAQLSRRCSDRCEWDMNVCCVHLWLQVCGSSRQLCFWNFVRSS